MPGNQAGRLRHVVNAGGGTNGKTTGPAVPVALQRMARESGLSQMQYLGTTLDTQRIQNAMRAAERGDTWLLFTIIRDMISNYPHLNAEWNKRKMVIIGQPLSLTPADPTDKDDKVACKVIAEAIDNCENWEQGMQHLLDGTLKPLAAGEKIYEAISLAERTSGKYKWLKNYRLKQIAPISDLLHCYKIPYMPGGLSRNGGNPATLFNVDDWEPWLRFYHTEPNGMVRFGTMEVYAPDPVRHIIHRGNLLSTTMPPNFGGYMRMLLFIWLFGGQARDSWTLMMNKYGMPIPVAEVDSANEQIMNDVRSALSLGAQLGGIAIPKGSKLTWSGVPGTDGSNQHKVYQDWMNCETSKLVLGQVTSARPEKGGLAGGMAEQSEAVRDDIRMWDTTSLRSTLRKQLFRQILDLNGYGGRTPIPTWGGAKPGDAAMLGRMLRDFYTAGLRPTATGIVTSSERTGVEMERVPEALLKHGGGRGGDGEGKAEAN
jgi:phage gp29-like protein